jgi:pimeloyl-ACP methyl ester carboxylesterase
MNTDIALTVPPRFVEAGGIRFAYLRWGKTGGLPVVFPQYSSANLDDWDPQVTDALALKKFGIVWFSQGGMIAQQLALDHPDRVNRIIPLGTRPRGGEGMTFTELPAEEKADPERFPAGAAGEGQNAWHHRFCSFLRGSSQPRSKLPRSAALCTRIIRPSVTPGGWQSVSREIRQVLPSGRRVPVGHRR